MRFTPCRFRQPETPLFRSFVLSLSPTNGTGRVHFRLSTQMDITRFIVSRRNDALLVGDYGSYRKQLSRRLLTVRRRLGRTSPKGRKYAPKTAISAEDISSNPEFVALILLTSERAWAHALYMKSMHSADSSAKDITGSTKKHVISRLHKAEQTAAHLLDLLRFIHDKSDIPNVVLEARAYRCMLRGSSDFESRKWENCLKAYSEAHLLYKALARTSGANQRDPFSELLSSTVDPSIRYAAYQLRLPRTLSITRIVSRFLPQEGDFIREVLKHDPDLLKEGSSSTKTASDTNAKDLPKTISWRTRTVNIEDANIGQALAAVSAAEQKMAASLASATDLTLKEQAVAYDEVLLPSQDAVDATKTAIDELTADGVTQSDQRMQGLQITRTAVNYALVSWRIGRNRVLCGRNDGAPLDQDHSKNMKRPRDTDKPATASDESNGKKLARLRERVVLYDIILQSLDSVKELPGVAADQNFLEELETQRSYFSALRSLAIGRSHKLLSNSKNALAIFARALSHAPDPLSSRFTSPAFSKPVNIEVTKSQATSLHHLLESLAVQHRALVEIENLSSEAVRAEKLKAAGAIPLVERLDEYPVNGADLTNLVVYPPRLRPVPVKPLFLDVAWTYIDYPGRATKRQAGANRTAQDMEGKAEEKKEGKKGWFGFGR
ncbi:hypothetical protein MMC13_007849 [Lambiella insularis]|nr:hypothetical protein [Lambiella insularis]